MANKSVMICTPCFDGKVNVEYVNSLLFSMIAAGDAGWQCQWKTMSGNSLINHARAILGQDFWESNCDVMFQIDADMGWDPKGFMRILLGKHDIMAGVYPVKTEDPKNFMTRGWTTIPGSNLLETRGAGGGFIRVNRSALGKMREAYPELMANYRGRWMSMLWNTMIRDNGDPLGEDFAFCERWCQLGDKVYIDPDIDFKHIGTKIYEGNFFREAMMSDPAFEPERKAHENGRWQLRA